MKNPIKTFVDVIDTWNTMVEMAADIGAEDGQVRLWKSRNNIPPAWWKSIVDAAKARLAKGENERFKHITLELLAELAEGSGSR